MFKKAIITLLGLLQFGVVSFADDAVELKCGYDSAKEFSVELRDEYQKIFRDEVQDFCFFTIFVHDECVLIEEDEILQCSYDLRIENLTDELDYFMLHDIDLYKSGSIFTRKRSLSKPPFVNEGLVQVQFDVSSKWSFALDYDEAKKAVEENLSIAPHYLIIDPEESEQLSFRVYPAQ